MILQLYVLRSFGRHKFIGAVETTVESLCSARDNESKYLVFIPELKSSTLSVEFVRLLSKYHSNGTMEDLECTLEFLVTVSQQVSEHHTSELEVAVQQAQVAASQLQTIAPIVGQTLTAVDDMNIVVNKATTTVSPWLPLLENVKAFVEVMNGVAAVCC